MDVYEKALQCHERWGGKWEVKSKTKVENADDLSVAYTPGVAQPCLEIKKDAENAYKYTLNHNLVAVVSEGTAVLGLGNIGALAAMPVMEGKCILFKEFAGVDAVPVVLDTQDVDEVVRTVKNIAPSFGGINLEDISAPRCFEIERRLKEELDIPVMHDDQHGTAIVVLAAVINSLKVVGKKADEITCVINGMGAAGTSIANLLMTYGVKKMICCDRDGILNDKNAVLPHHRELVKKTGSGGRSGTLADALKGADRRLTTALFSPWLTLNRKSCPTSRKRRAPPWSARAGAISLTRSTTCWLFRGCSAGRLTPKPKRLPRS